MRKTRSMGRVAVGCALGVILLASAACDGKDGIIGIGGDELAPRAFDARYAWVLHGWEPGGLQPIGHAGVILTWALPTAWSGEVFRVYARRSGVGSYGLISTVTSCADGLCRYTDLNVTPGESYDYFVATTDERTGQEIDSEAIRVDVPRGSAPVAPAAPTVTALDGALYLQWPSTGAERYRVFLERIGSSSDFIEIGETDGTGFLDERAENGVEYGYRIAAIDTLGQFSARSPIGAGIPRPDYHAELIWAFGQNPEDSGFRFRQTDTSDPIVSGTSADAQWRLERIDGVLSIRPLGTTGVTQGVFTSALTCGPESEADCLDVTVAPGSSSFLTSPVAVGAANTYVFRVTGDDGRIHYGKVRVVGETVDAAGSTVVVLDWAYQLAPDEPRLNRAGE